MARGGCLLLLVLSLHGQNAKSAGSAVTGSFRVTAKTVQGRLRVAGSPGDLGLQNQHVTAIVRKKDGWLVDFWPNRATQPTARQLIGAPKGDGIWQLTPRINDGRRITQVRYDTVTATGDSIRASAELSVARTRFRLETQYRLAPDQPEIHLTSELSHVSGPHAHIKFQEALKWGNTDYFIDRTHAPLNKFSGTSRWIGRHGLGGDLKWIRLDVDPFYLDFSQSYPGLAPQIVATYALLVIEPGKTHRFSRKLSYEDLPRHRPKPPPTGTLQAAVVDENGQALAAKLGFKGLVGTKTPDFGNDGNESGVSRFAWSGTGHFERPLPVGRYRVVATAGPERASESWEVDIEANETTKIQGSLPRAVETPGWISADLHLHQVESVDADVAHSSRLIAVAAEGVELAAATDHYAVTDFAPTVAQLVAAGRLASPLATMVGSEISTVGNRFGHFNLFPMSLDDWVKYEDTTPKAMLAEMRQVAPDAVIQVNHPRWPGIGYFQVHGMDPKTHRIPMANRASYASDFDAVEVFNGLDAYSHPRIRLVLRDWLALLGRGHRYTATGNSDSHKLAFQDPGLPRNLIRHGKATSDAQDPFVSEAAIVDGIKRGRVLVTNGPIIDVDANGQGLGDTIKSDGKPVSVNVRVRAAPWVDVSQVEVLVGPTATRLRYVPIPPSKQLVRYEEAIRVPAYQKTFLIVLVTGKKPLENVYATGVRPLAFTNPIWIEP